MRVAAGIAAGAVAIAALAAATLFLVAARLVVRVDQRVLPQVSVALASIQAIETNTTRSEAELAGLLNQTRHIAMDERASQAEQLRRVDALLTQLGAVAAEASAAISDLDKQGTLAVAGATEDETRLAALITSTQADSHALLGNAAVSLDPSATRGALANLVDASGSVKRATEDAAASMADVRAGVHYEIKQLMAPVTKAKAIGEESVRILGKFLGY